jgi:hypothetical protein
MKLVFVTKKGIIIILEPSNSRCYEYLMYHMPENLYEWII